MWVFLSKERVSFLQEKTRIFVLAKLRSFAIYLIFGTDTQTPYLSQFYLRSARRCDRLG